MTVFPKVGRIETWNCSNANFRTAEFRVRACFPVLLLVLKLRQMWQTVREEGYLWDGGTWYCIQGPTIWSTVKKRGIVRETHRELHMEQKSFLTVYRAKTCPNWPWFPSSTICVSRNVASFRAHILRRSETSKILLQTVSSFPASL